jgi:2-keto-3-deoxygluconate permease
MKIKQNIERIPGGMMIVPLILGAVINSFWPSLINIGGLTTALAKGSAPLIGAFLVCMGAGINLKVVPTAAKKGVAITVVKFLVGAIMGIGVSYFFGATGFFGLSALAIISAVTNSNGGLYAALVGELGDESDVGAIAILSVNDGPFLTMLALGAAGLGSFPFGTILSVVLPLLVGICLGNLDEDLRKFIQQGGFVLIPFFAFSLGVGLDFKIMYEAGLAGILLGLLTTVVGGFFNIVADKAVGGTGIAGAAASTTAGNAVATPAALALVDPTLAPLVKDATAQIAAAVITTIILAPLLTQYMAKKHMQKQGVKHTAG